MSARPALAVVCLLGSAVPGSASSQADAREDRYQAYLAFDKLVRGGEVSPQWLPHGSRFVFADTTSGETRFFLCDPADRTVRPLFDVERLRTALGHVFGRPLATSGVPIRAVDVVGDGSRIGFDLEGRAFTLDLTTYELAERSAEEYDRHRRQAPKLIRSAYPHTLPPLVEIPSPDGTRLMTMREENLWLREVTSAHERALTTDAAPDIDWSLLGAAWSHDGRFFAALRSDARGVRRTRILRYLEDDDVVDEYPRSLAGGAKAEDTLFVFDLTRGTQAAVITARQDAYLAIHGFSADSRELLYYRLARPSKRVELVAYQLDTQRSRTVLSESSRTFLYYLPSFLWRAQGRIRAHFIDDGRRFIWRSERDGWAHYYLYDGDGRLVRRLTSGEYPVLDIVHVDEARKLLYFTAHPDQAHPYDVHLMRVPLRGGAAVPLTRGRGQRTIEFAPSSRYFIETLSTRETPPVSLLKESANGVLVKELARADISALRAVGWTAPEEITALSADGKTRLYGTLFKPADFDPRKSYPVVEYIYGGGFMSLAPHGFRPRELKRHVDLLHALVQLGFIGIVIDGRGTPERSKAFQDVLFGQLGRHEIADHVAVLKAVAAERPYMDMKRVGIFGTSYGGYFATRALLLAPEIYHVGIASAPADTQSDAGAIAIEAFMGGGPADNPAGYAFTDNKRLVDRLRGKLLIIIGTNDVNVPFRHVMRFVNALAEAGKPYELVVMPDQNHHFMQRDSKRRHPYWEYVVRRHLVENLKPD